ncbi:MAG: glycosyltransferase [Oscillospiraceae bacterium]|nr:glycosyltransferase [Oscillospiraceae bacterium]
MVSGMDFLGMHEFKKHILVFDHQWGGGATDYINNLISSELNSGSLFMTVRFGTAGCRGRHPLQGHLDNYSLQFQSLEVNRLISLNSLSCLLQVLDKYPCSEIIINELVSYPNLYATLDFISGVKNKHGAELSIHIHDYFSVCPSFFLLNSEKKFCDVPDSDICEKCFEKLTFSDEYDNIITYRQNWKAFFDQCDEVVVFSNSSEAILEKVYGANLKISVKPHRVDYITKVSKLLKTTNTLNIGVLGAINEPKGVFIIQEIIDIIEAQGLNIKVILLGDHYGIIAENKHILTTGKYEKSDIPHLTVSNDIDMFFVPSICPETFSYTTEEIIKMGMPVACFNIGAPSDRVGNYEKGLLIDKIDAKYALNAITEYLQDADTMGAKAGLIRKGLHSLRTNGLRNTFERIAMHLRN